MTVTTLPAPPIETVQPSASFEEVTPQLAASWLALNKANRPPKSEAQVRYMRDMQAGNWLLTGEPIIFDWNGRLIDGQNRLGAMVKLGQTLTLLVVRGIDPAAQDVMDAGAKRTAIDMLAMHGYKNTGITAAATRLAINWDRGWIGPPDGRGSSNVTNAEIKAFVADDPLMGWAATHASAFHSIPAPGSVVAFAMWLLARTTGDPGKVRAFFSDLSEMRTQGSGDPRYALLRRLAKARDNRERLGKPMFAYGFLRAWAAVEANEELIHFPLTARHWPKGFKPPAPVAA